jgi:PAS domain S-box-containing protein
MNQHRSPVLRGNGAGGTADRLRDLLRTLGGPGQAPPDADPAAALRDLDSLLEIVSAAEEDRVARADLLEAAHREAEVHRLRYQQLFEFVPAPCLVTDAHGLITEANQAAAELLQTRKEFLRGKPLGLFVTGGFWKFYDHMLRAVSRTGATPRFDAVLRSTRGKSIHASLAGWWLPGDGDVPGAVRWVLIDLEPWRQAENWMRQEKDFRERLLDAVQAAVLVLDDRGHILRSNTYLLKAFGPCVADALGKEWSSCLVPPEDRPAARQLVEQARAAGSAGTARFSLVGPGETRHPFVWSARMLGSFPPATQVLPVGQDISELEEAQRQALRAERLAAIGQMTAAMAHDSRNALQRTQACLERLAWRLQDQPDALDLVRRAQAAQEELHALYEEVREFAAPICMEREVCPLPDVWRQAWAELTPLWTGRHARLHEETGDVDLRLAVDADRLRRVFRNLLENALDACAEPAHVTIACTAATLEGVSAVRVTVRDNGPGLAHAERGRVFEPFYTTKTKGTGLGLSIARRLVEAHGGRIEAGSGPGGVFIITLPAPDA